MTNNTYADVLNGEKMKMPPRSRAYAENKKSSNKRKNTQAGKYWKKVFQEELGVRAQLSGSLTAFLTKVAVKNKKQLREWLGEHRLGGVLGIPNMGPSKLKMLYAAAEVNGGANKKKSEPLKEKPSVKNRNYGQTISLTSEQENRFEEVAGGTRMKPSRYNSPKGKNHPTVTLYNDDGMIMSFGKRKAQAILDVFNNPSLLADLEKFAGYSDRDVTLPYQSPQNGASPCPADEQKTPPTFSDVLAAHGVKSDITVGFDLLDAVVAHLGVQTEMGKEFVMVALECIELFDKKQRDYGSANITMSGQAGLAYRLMDKACRLQHLIQKREKNAGTPENESIEDSFLDSANLGMIGILVTRGYWK